jgi:deoxyribonuclease-4
VSPAGGLPKAVERGAERGCEAIQIFNQSPRMWRSSAYGEEDVAAFRDALPDSGVKAVLIHAAYLLNCASDDPEIRSKSLASLVGSLRAGRAIGASAVVLHPGSAKAGALDAAIARAGETIREALEESERCALHLENTAGAGDTLGRSMDELAALLEAAGAHERLGVCLDSCHLLASGYEVRTAKGMDAVLAEATSKLGADRLGSLHLNDSVTPLGSNRDRHANIGKGELGEGGCAAFLGAPGLQRLPCVLETPGEKGTGASGEEVALARRLHERGRTARRRARGAARGATGTGRSRKRAQKAGTRLGG